MSVDCREKRGHMRILYVYDDIGVHCLRPYSLKTIDKMAYSQVLDVLFYGSSNPARDFG